MLLPEMGLYILGDDDEPRKVDDVLVWGRWMETADRIVAHTRVGQWYVSTVFLGIDHNFMSDGPPVLWETMIFGKDDWEDWYQERYTSKLDALIGHQQAVEEAERKPGYR